MSHFYFRVIPDDERWQARRGGDVLGAYDEFDDALTRARVEAALNQPSEVIVHLPDGGMVSDCEFAPRALQKRLSAADRPVVAHDQNQAS